MRLIEKQGVYTDADSIAAKRRFTIVTTADEEIDVDASSRREAGAIAQAAIDRDYEPAKVAKIIGPRYGLYM